jgi:hypothetical protein
VYVPMASPYATRSRQPPPQNDAAVEAGASSSNAEAPPPVANPGVGGTARGALASGESASVDPAAQAETFLRENEQMCKDHWKNARRAHAPNQEANMKTLECFDEDEQPLKIKEETLITFLKYIAANLKKLAEFLSVRNVNMHNVCVAAFKYLVQTTGGFMRLDIYHGLIEKGHTLEQLDILPVPSKGVRRMYRNGVVECDISLMPEVSERDCAVVALNNAVGHPQFSRKAMAQFQPAFKKGDMPVKQLVRAISSGRSPYVGKECKQLKGSYKVFLKTSGVYVVCMTLFLKDGTQQSHMISFDAYRDILCFGMDDEGFEQITFLIEKPDRKDEIAARDNLLSHFPKLKRMEVTFVIEMGVKLKALAYTHEPAYTIQKPTPMDVVCDGDDGAGVYPKGTPEYDEKRKTQPKPKARSASAIITESPPESKKARTE